MKCIGRVCCWGVVGAMLWASTGRTQELSTSLDLANWIDARFEDVWKSEGLEPANTVNDAILLRRVYLDVRGTIPPVAAARDFLASDSSVKRHDLVDALLNPRQTDEQVDERAAEHWARVWRRVLIPANAPGAMLAARLDPWLEEQFEKNTPYDEFVRRLLTVKQDTNGGADQGALTFYQAIGLTPENMTTATAKSFLGVRLGCAQCHDHPFADWTQEDFWGLAAFFAGTYQDGEIKDERVTKITPADGDVEYVAKFLWSEEKYGELPKDKTPREVLADWITAKGNPNFAATAVNRVWQHLCGRSLVGTVDDLDIVTDDEREILDELAQHFVAADYDLKWLIAGICKSKVYQRASLAPGQEADERFATHRPLKTLTPEQVFDSLEQALMLPVTRDTDPTTGSPRYNGMRAQFVQRLNESIGESPEDFRAGIPQALMIMNGKLTGDATDLKESRTLRGVVDAPFLKPTDKVRTLYLAALTREPNERELRFMLRHIDGQPDREAKATAYGDILWGLLNSPEFVLAR